MHPTPVPGAKPFLRFFPWTLFFLAAVAVWSGLVLGLAAQNPNKKPPKEEEEEKTKPAKPAKPLRVEDEEPTKPVKPKSPLRADVDSPPKPTTPQENAAPAQLTDLVQEARQAKQRRVRELFTRLALPHDVLSYRDGRVIDIEPVFRFVGAEPNFDGSLQFWPLDDKGKRRPSREVARDAVKRIEHYEETALSLVDRFLKDQERELTNSVTYLPRMEVLQIAEKALAAVIRFHESALLSGQRKGDDWKPLEKGLRDKLKGVQLDQVRAQAQTKDWEDAYALAYRLATNYPNDREVQTEVAKLLARQAANSFDAKDYRETQKRLRLLEDIAPNSSEARPIRDKLIDKAKSLYKQAKELEGKDNPKAITLLEQAESIWPHLEEVRNSRLKLSNAFSVLKVGVRELPQYMSPGTATLDCERQALELLFESLVKPSYDARQGQRYLPGLAVGRPQQIPLGRRFQLPIDAKWSDGEKVTAADVRNTLKLFSNPDLHQTGAAWADLLEEDVTVRDPFRVNLIMKQGFLDPLSLMTFKVLPPNFGGKTLSLLTDKEFAEQPLGSGPFRYDGRKMEGGTEYASFVANPFYDRTGNNVLPKIREIHLFRSREPEADFANNRLQLLLDLPTKEIDKLKTTSNVNIQTLRNRRVYFLAVNHRQPLLRDQDLRQAIGHAIDRATILKDCFQFSHKVDGVPPHRPLNGPYPPGSWAYNTERKNMPADPFDLPRARLHGNKFKGKLNVVQLTFKYPDDDPAVKKACEAIRDQVRALGTGIDLVPQARSPRQLHEEVEGVQDYQLAYYYFDFPTEDCWLWPLFYPRRLGSEKYSILGYEDSELETRLQEVNNHRDFEQVKKSTHAIHALIYDKMPLIPLWQLDTHMAIHNDLKVVGLDPLLVFTNVAEWELQIKN